MAPLTSNNWLGNVSRVVLQEFEALRMRFHRDDLGIWPEVMTQYRKTSDVRSDVYNGSNVVGTKIVDLIFVLKDCIGKLGAGRLNVKIAAEDLIAG